MRQRPHFVGLGLALMLALSFSFAYSGQPGGGDGDAKDQGRRIDRLVTQLGGDSFAEREEARKELEAIGAAALPSLRKAVMQGDLEVSRRAADLIRIIEERSLSADLLKPKKVHLKLNDVPVLEAVAQLAKLSGYAVRIDGDRTMLADKRVTIDTGEVTFWEALDKLNEKAGLAEKVTIASQPGDSNTVTVNSYFADVRLERALIRAERAKKVVRQPPPPLKMMKLPKKVTGDTEFDDKGQPKPKPPADAKPDDKPAEKPDPKDTKESKEEKASTKEIIDRRDALLVKAEAQTKEIQGEIYGGVAGKGPPSLVTPGRVILAPSTATKQYVSYAGAARVTLKHPKTAKPQANGKHYDLVLEVSAEPRLLGFTLSGVPTIAKAIDEHGQPLSFLIDPPAPPKKEPEPVVRPGIGVIDIDISYDMMFGRSPVAVQPSVTVRLQQGEKPARRLKELAGSLSAMVLVPDTLLASVDHVMKAKGKSTEIKGGGRLHLDVAEKLSDTEFRFVMKLENLPAGPNGGPNFAVNGNRLISVNGGFGDYAPQLLDAKGNRLATSAGPSLNQEADPNTGQIIKTTVELRVRRDTGQGEPARLAITGTHAATVAVPFRFVDVPLP